MESTVREALLTAAIRCSSLGFIASPTCRPDFKRPPFEPLVPPHRLLRPPAPVSGFPAPHARGGSVTSLWTRASAQLRRSSGTSIPLDEPPLWRGCDLRVMRRTKEQSGDELGGSSLIAHDQRDRETGEAYILETTKAPRPAKSTRTSDYSPCARKHRPSR